MGLGVPNFKHLILKRLPDGPNGQICWVVTQEREEEPTKNIPSVKELREDASKLKVGETKVIFIR